MNFRLKPWMLKLAPLYFLILTAVYFTPTLFGGRIFHFRDLFFFHYPLRHYWIDQLWKGYPPYINVALNGGQPVLSNPNYAIFYPGNVLYFLLPFDVAWNWTLAGHVFWALLGIYALCRQINFPRTAAFAAAVTFAFSGPVMSSLNYYNLLIAVSWTPWVITFYLKSINNRRFAVLAALAWAIQLLAGEPTVQLMTVVLVFGIALFLKGGPLRKFQPFLILLIGGILLSALQLLPAITWLPETSRSAGLDFRLSGAYWSLHPKRLIELLVPHYFGYPMSDFSIDYWGGSLTDAGFPYFPSVYSGWIPLLLVPAAWRTRTGRFGVILAAVSLLLSLGRWLPGYQLMYDALPLLRLIRYPEKYLLCFSLGCSIITAAGITEHLKEFRAAQSIVWFSLLLVASLLALILPFDSILPAQVNLRTGAVWQAVLCGAFSCIVLGMMKKQAWKFALASAIPVLLLVDVASVNWVVPRTAPLSEVQSRPEILMQDKDLIQGNVLHRGEDQTEDYYKSALDPDSFLTQVAHPMTGLVWGVHYGATSDIDRMGWLPSFQRAERIRRHFPETPCLTEMRATGIDRVISLSPISHPELRLTKTVHLQKQVEVYVYKLFPPAAPFASWEKGSGSLRWLNRIPDRIYLQTKTAEQGAIVIQRNALPGWRLKQGESWIPLQSSADGMIHVQVEPGEHQIELRYVPPGLISGAIISGITLIVLLAMLIIA